MKQLHFVTNCCLFVRKTFLCIILSSYIKGIFLVSFLAFCLSVCLFVSFCVSVCLIVCLFVYVFFCLPFVCLHLSFYLDGQFIMYSQYKNWRDFFDLQYFNFKTLGLLRKVQVYDGREMKPAYEYVGPEVKKGFRINIQL